ncbi:MAG: flavin reductase [Erysipelotrichaceae bacterium]|nr:flavin reductase [Erysipelotrichaceae bacterium]
MKKEVRGHLKFMPQPVLMIGTYDENGIPNLMNAAWGGQYDYDMIFIALAEHKTTDNIRLKKEFTVAFATKDTLTASDYFGIESGKKVNKIEKAGFHARKSEKIDAPVFDEYPVTLECRLVEENDYGIIADVIGTVADESVLNEEGQIDLDKAGLISFDPTSNSYRVIGEKAGAAFSAGLTIKNK